MALIEYEDDKRGRKTATTEFRHTTFADKCLRTMFIGITIASSGYLIEIVPEPALLLKAIGLSVAIAGTCLLIIAGAWWMIRKTLKILS